MTLFPHRRLGVGVSVRSDVGVCRGCGAVELARDMVRVAPFVYACRPCAQRGTPA